MKENKPYDLKVVAFKKPAGYQKGNSAYPKNEEVLAADNYLDKQDILQRLHISARTLQRWRNKNLIVHTKIGGKIFYSENALKEMMRKGFGGK